MFLFFHTKKRKVGGVSNLDLDNYETCVVAAEKQWPSEATVQSARSWITAAQEKRQVDSNVNKLTDALTQAVDAEGNYTVSGVAVFVSSTSGFPESFRATTEVELGRLVAYGKYVSEHLALHRGGDGELSEDQGLLALRRFVQLLGAERGKTFATFSAARMQATKVEDAIAQYELKIAEGSTLADDPDFTLTKRLMGETVGLEAVFDKRGVAAIEVHAVFDSLITTAAAKIKAIRDESIALAGDALAAQVGCAGLYSPTYNNNHREVVPNSCFRQSMQFDIGLAKPTRWVKPPAGYVCM